ncbi:MAG: cbb3-type cytochrome oxidase assembly protein CcoS [Boseongicola sp.]
MNVLIILVPVSLSLAFIGLLAFLWTLKNEQYDDLEGDAWRILSEDDPETEIDDLG